MKRNILWAIASAAVMVGLPVLSRLVPADAGMAVVFLLFFAVDPVYSVLTGVFAGREGRDAWSRPLIAALLFPLGTGLAFTWTEPVFWGYAAGYLALGYAAYGIARSTSRGKKKR